MDEKASKKDAGKLGLIGLIALSVSAMVGSGVFDLPKNMSQVAGLDAQVLAWITTGIGIWFIAEMFVILSDVHPELQAGLYKYGEVGFGPFVGFFTAWGYFVCECFANVAYAVLVMSTLDYFFPGTFTGGSNWPSVIGASIITWLITALVLRGVEVSSTVQKVATAIMLAVMVIFLATVAVHFNPHTFTMNATATHSVASVSDHPLGSIGHQLLNTMMITLWLFGGIEGAVVMSGKARDPKQVPKATVIGFIVCLVLFAATGILSLGAFSYGQLAKMTSPSTAYILISLWHNNLGRDIITFGLLVAVFSSWISWVQMLSELPQHAAEEDHAFPQVFAKKSKRNVPIVSVLVATVIMQIIIIFAHFDNNAYQMLLTITGTMTVAPYMVSAMYLIKIGAKEDLFPTNTKHKRINGLIIGILAFLYTVIMGLAAGVRYIAISFIIYAIGIPVYIWARKEQHEKHIFKIGELIFAIIIVIVAIAGLYVSLVRGGIKMAKLDLNLNKQGIDRIAISPYKQYSRGYMEPGNIGNGYVTGLKVDAGVRDKTDDDVLDGIVSYDRAETKNAYIGQINMTTASSFTGPQGHVVGYDILRNPEVDKVKPLFVEKQWDGSDLPIYDAKPLQDALVEYFGMEQERRHYPAPGSFIVCANKGVTAERPKADEPLKPGQGYGVWSAIAISFAKDPSKNSSMFIEDAGVWETPNEDELIEYLNGRRKAIAKSIAECGQDADTAFESSWIGFAHVMMKPGQIGNAITVGPYFSLPVNSIPNGSILTPDKDMEIMENLSLPEWLDKMGYESLVKKNNVTY